MKTNNMASSWLWLLGVAAMAINGASANYESQPLLSDTMFLREMVARMGSGLADPAAPDYLDLPARLPASLDELVPPRSMKSGGGGEGGVDEGGVDYDVLALHPSLRDQEYLAHSHLLGSMLAHYPDGNQGTLRLKPSSGETPSTTAELKTDGVLPAYCNPPNPCPVGYTAADGCLEEFENTAAFSRDYQAQQECMCDTEHMFECPDSTRDSELAALARSIQNEGVLDSTLDKIMDDLDTRTQRVVAKKFHQKKSHNPFLEGERLPIAAKKGLVM